MATNERREMEQSRVTQIRIVETEKQCNEVGENRNKI